MIHGPPKRLKSTLERERWQAQTPTFDNFFAHSFVLRRGQQPERNLFYQSHLRQHYNRGAGVYVTITDPAHG